MKHRTLAVIGHVDHGKTSLVKTLTGVETDTLKEEKQRGLSITLGFAHLKFPSGHVHLIDTPGHADFIRMTASGVSGADAVLLVVSAVDGVQPQTREHVRMAGLFGIRDVIVALTKIDLVPDKDVRQAGANVEALLDTHGFSRVDVVPCSSTTGDGIDTLIATLERNAAHTNQATDLKGFFLPIDRVFSAPGVGTIVTGSLLGGSISVEDEVLVEPTHQRATIRRIEVAGIAHTQAMPSSRVALNLRGLDAASIQKGDVLCAPGKFQAGQRFDVALQSDPTLKHMEQVTVLQGTSHGTARLRLYPENGSPTVYGQLEFQAPQIAFPGQRVVLRRPSRAEILTGGTVIDPNAVLVTRNKPAHVRVLRARLERGADAVARAIADRDNGIVDLKTLSRLGGAPPENDFEAISETLIARKADIETLRLRLIDALNSLHARRPCRPYIETSELYSQLRPAPRVLKDAVVDRLRAAGEIREHQNGVALADFDPLANMTTELCGAYHDADQRLCEMGVRPVALFESPSQDESDLVELLVWKNRALRLYNHSLKQTLLLSSDAIEEARNKLRLAFPDGSEFTTSAARAVLNTNRKTIVPLLEYFDANGVTRRDEDVRVITSDFDPTGARP
ncbi:MAG: selenocysteine-specific translation elongation factor [Pseudomonadota bacterium]